MRTRAREQQLRPTLELGHVPYGAWVDFFVITVVICHDRAPLGRVRAIEALWVGVLYNAASANDQSVTRTEAYEAVNVHRAGAVDKVSAFTGVVVRATRDPSAAG